MARRLRGLHVGVSSDVQHLRGAAGAPPLRPAGRPGQRLETGTTQDTRDPVTLRIPAKRDLFQTEMTCCGVQT